MPDYTTSRFINPKSISEPAPQRVCVNTENTEQHGAGRMKENKWEGVERWREGKAKAVCRGYTFGPTDADFG